MAFEIEITKDDLKRVLNEEDIRELSGETYHLGRALPIDKAATVIRGVVARITDLAPAGFEISKCSIDLELKGSPFGIGMNSTARVELSPRRAAGE